MPQSSLLGWLNKRSQSSEKSPLEPSKEQMNTSEVTPHVPSSSEHKLDGPTASSTAFLNGSTSQSPNGTHKLPPQLEFRACHKEDIPRLKQLNSLLLPIPYPENFYRETYQDPTISNITLLAVWHKDPSDPKIARREKETLVGAIRCRILNDSPTGSGTGPTKDGNGDGPMLYLSTLVLLSPFRSQGIATSMLDAIIKRAVEAHGVRSVSAHVWEANAEGLEWYRKRGFTELRREEGYYPRLKPTAAVVMRKRIGVLDVVGKEMGRQLVT